MSAAAQSLLEALRNSSMHMKPSVRQRRAILQPRPAASGTAFRSVRNRTHISTRQRRRQSRHPIAGCASIRERSSRRPAVWSPPAGHPIAPDERLAGATASQRRPAPAASDAPRSAQHEAISEMGHRAPPAAPPPLAAGPGQSDHRPTAAVRHPSTAPYGSLRSDGRLARTN